MLTHAPPWPMPLSTGRLIAIVDGPKMGCANGATLARPPLLHVQTGPPTSQPAGDRENRLQEGHSAPGRTSPTSGVTKRMALEALLQAAARGKAAWLRGYYSAIARIMPLVLLTEAGGLIARGMTATSLSWRNEPDTYEGRSIILTA